MSNLPRIPKLEAELANVEKKRLTPFSGVTSAQGRVVVVLDPPAASLDRIVPIGMGPMVDGYMTLPCLVRGESTVAKVVIALAKVSPGALISIGSAPVQVAPNVPISGLVCTW